MKLLHFIMILIVFYATSTKAENDADNYYGKTEMEAARNALKQHHGNSNQLFLMADRLEYKTNAGDPLTVWEGQGWYGNDLNKLWLRTEGEYQHDSNIFEKVELQTLYSRAISSFWDIQAGIRHDIKPNPSRTYGVIGFQGLAPYWFEVIAASFISDQGDISLRFETEYELLITQRLILQPRIELNVAFSEDEELEIGSGLNSLETGLRLRYEIKREIAPYIGISWNKAFGSTADFIEADGNDTDSLSFVAGIRLWY